MALDINSEQLLTFLINASSIMTIVLLSLFLYLIILRILKTSKHQRVSRFGAYWQPILFEAVVTGDSNIQKIPRAFRLDRDEKVLWFAENWSQLHAYVTGSGGSELNKFGRAMRLEERFAALVYDDNVHTRVSALIALSDLETVSVETIAIVRDEITTGDAMVALALVRFMIKHQHEEIVPLLITLQGRIPSQRLVSVLKIHLFETESALSFVEQVEDTLQTCEANIAVFLMKVTDGLELSLSSNTIAEVLHKFSEESEVCANAIALIDSPDLLPLAIEYINHEHSSVRVQATKALGRVGGIEEAELLWVRLTDPDWWVRLRAAEALINLPGISNLELIERLDTLEDKFSKEVLTQVIDEKINQLQFEHA